MLERIEPHLPRLKERKAREAGGGMTALDERPEVTVHAAASRYDGEHGYVFELDEEGGFEIALPGLPSGVAIADLRVPTACADGMACTPTPTQTRRPTRTACCS